MAEPLLSPCGALVRRGDPDRFLAAMTAPARPRERLFALYAFNLEIARIPSVVSEPMLGAIRLQWWRDAVEMAFEGRSRSHEVAEPLAATIREARLPRAAFVRLLDARAQDMQAEPFADRAALDLYLRDTGAGLLDLAARALAPEGGGGGTEDAGFAFAAANWLLAAPALAAAGRAPFPPGEARAQAQGLARDALTALARARAARPPVPKAARAAFLAGWRAEPILRATLRPDYAPDAGPEGVSPFRRQASLLWAAAVRGW